MRLQVLFLGIAIALLGVPVQGALAGEPCPPCCSQAMDEPCDDGAAPCGGSLAAVSCCEAAPSAPHAPVRTVDFQGLQWVAPATASGWPAAERPPRPLRDDAVLALPSPFRLSVVLLI